MRVCVIGATGFVGRALVPALRREGHSVVAWARSTARARGLLGAEIEVVADRGGHGAHDALRALIERSDAVVNLAGEPLVGRRWTAARRRQLRASRVRVTEQLVAAIAEARIRPRVLVQGSAVGYYGDRGGEPLPESASPGDGFLADLCRCWEQAAWAATAHGVRVVVVRTGVALGRDGGALAQMLTPFRLGVGGPFGSGRQFFPWIHLHDLVRLITKALADERYGGPVNAVAPETVTGLQFAKALGRALHRPAALPMPAMVLRALFGASATVLVSSQRAEPRALADLGFIFWFPTLDAALEDLVGAGPATISGVAGREVRVSDPDSQAYLERTRPTAVLRVTTVIPAPVDEVFAFFSKAENLGLITPAAMKFAIEGDVPAMESGARIRYRLRIGPMRIGWGTRILCWEPGRRFVDLQESGPYRVWWHEHVFRAEGDHTVMDDCVYYAPPLGALGRIANRLVIAPMLRQVFHYRSDVIRLRFGGP